MIRIKFTKSQWERFSEISAACGTLSLGSAVIPFLLGQSELIKAFWGMVGAIMLWYISIWVAKKY